MTQRKQQSALQPWKYTATARSFHWILAGLLPAMAALGWYMMSIEKEPNSGWYFDLHKSIGITVFSLVALRLAWRLSLRPQRLPVSVPGWEQKLSSLIQWLLYACMTVIPASGFTGALFSKDGLAFFGLPLPHPIPNHDLSEQLFSIHGIAVWVLAGSMTIHVAGALKHLVVDRDRVFDRMWREAS